MSSDLLPCRALRANLETGSPAERAAAAQLMPYYGTSEQAGDLLLAIRRPDNQVLPDWRGTAAEEAMQGDKRTIAQHAMDAFLGLDDGGRVRSEADKVNAAMQLVVQKSLHDGQLRTAAIEFVRQSSDPRAPKLTDMAVAASVGGTYAQKTAAIELLRQFGGDDAASELLAMALKKTNQQSPRSSPDESSSSWLARVNSLTQASNDNQANQSQLQKLSVSQYAYDALSGDAGAVEVRALGQGPRAGSR